MLKAVALLVTCTMLSMTNLVAMQQPRLPMQIADVPTPTHVHQKRAIHHSKHCSCSCCCVCCPKLNEALDRSASDLSSEEFNAACCLPCSFLKCFFMYGKCCLEFYELCGDILCSLCSDDFDQGVAVD